MEVMRVKFWNSFEGEPAGLWTDVTQGVRGREGSSLTPGFWPEHWEDGWHCMHWDKGGTGWENGMSVGDM